MGSWETIRPDQFSKEEPVRESKGHSFIQISSKVTWPTYCRYCGHCALKNEISRLVTRIGCNYESDERYRRWLKTRSF